MCLAPVHSTVYLVCGLLCVSLQLKSQIESSVAAHGSLASSESEMEEDVVDSPVTIIDSQHSVSVAATDQTATFPAPTTSKGGKGKSTKKTAPRRAPGTDADEEAAAITNQLQRQQVEAGKIQGQITQLLEKDGASAMAHFGSFLGKLGCQIDERLVDGFYREALDLTLRTIAKSRSLPPLHPPAVHHPAQHAQYDQFQQNQFVDTQFQPQPPLPPTFTSLLEPLQPPTASSQQGLPAASMWDTVSPSAGMNTAQPVRPNSTPNISFGSISRLSNISQTLMTPGDPCDNPQTPGATNTSTGAGGYLN